MEAAVIRILLPCKHGCGENITYYGKEGHEKACKAGPCFCPDPGCCFRGQTTALFDHFTTHHKWPANNFIDYLWQTCFAPEVYPPNPSQGTRRLDVPAVPGIRVLRSDEGHLFLLNVASLESHALKVSIVSVQANTEVPVYTCSFSYKWRRDHCQNVWLDRITNSSLSNGLPEDSLVENRSFHFIWKDLYIEYLRSSGIMAAEPSGVFEGHIESAPTVALPSADSTEESV
ncbi:hypothetical protein ACQ4PT_071074 [Festuca glaucescens]